MELARRKEIQEAIINWYFKSGRKFYWRVNEIDDWSWVVLEILLRKTQAVTVNNFFPDFISKYCEPLKIIKVPDIEIEKDLYHLGLYRQRAEALKVVANTIYYNYENKVPYDKELLAQMKHIGPYISNAVACFCRGQKEAIVDMNVVRVLTRLKGVAPPKNARNKKIWEMAYEMLPQNNWVEYNYGLLDLGAMYCKARNIKCEACILNYKCASFNS